MRVDTSVDVVPAGYPQGKDRAEAHRDLKTIESAKSTSDTDGSTTEPKARAKPHSSAPDRFGACEESETP